MGKSGVNVVVNPIAGKQASAAASMHANVAKISAFLSVTFILFNWPYAVIDYFYDENLARKRWYGMLTVLINFMQVTNRAKYPCVCLFARFTLQKLKRTGW